MEQFPENFTENNLEQRMAEIIDVADKVLVKADQPDEMADDIQVLVKDLDKPELSKEAEKVMVQLVAEMYKELDLTKSFEAAEIEPIITALLRKKYLE